MRVEMVEIRRDGIMIMALLRAHPDGHTQTYSCVELQSRPAHIKPSRQV